MASNYLTQEDEQNFGRDLIDLAQRAATQALSPHLNQLAQDNKDLRQKLARESRLRLDQEVEKLVPDYQTIDRNPRWHRWLLGIDQLSSRVRQTLLNEAVARGNANRVREFFERFRREDTSQAPSVTYGQRSMPSGQIYTRALIGQLYEAHRKGEYKNREAEWNRIEADIFRAQREGRVQDTPYLTK